MKRDYFHSVFLRMTSLLKWPIHWFLPQGSGGEEGGVGVGVKGGGITYFARWPVRSSLFGETDIPFRWPRKRGLHQESDKTSVLRSSSLVHRQTWKATSWTGTNRMEVLKWNDRAVLNARQPKLSSVFHDTFMDRWTEKQNDRRKAYQIEFISIIEYAV